MSDHKPLGALEATVVPRFAGPGTFARLPLIDAVPDYDIAVLGVPFDGGTSYRPGARFGPMGIRQASRHLRPRFHVELDTAPLETVQVVDAGDVPCTPYSIDEAVGQIERFAREVVGQGDRRLVTLGGDHTVALPMLRAARDKYGPIALIHFDAHLDTWDTYFKAPTTHGTVFRRAFEEGLLAEEKSIHIGIRGPIYDRLDLIDDASFGFRIIRAGDLDVLGIGGAVDIVRQRVGDAPVYLSIDIDVLDPAFAPGTGTPEMGGFTGRELLHLLRRLDGLNIIGGDVVETAPAYDNAEITCLAAATVAFDLITLMSKTNMRTPDRSAAATA
ncbi:agmatinase [Streptomyces atratus]|jgi:agmatinase|uniref:Agmatinase n=1 Tax=Streptomyces atratus TaxID=1893 RepID=A0A1K2FAV4_STRAR|nr:agmatinase [Streptomyces atratus]SFY44859.1 agmatinase [Streptomyces atratus]